MKLNSTPQKTAVVLAAFAMLNAAAMLNVARADVKYTTAMSTNISGAMKMSTTSTTLLKEGLERVDSKIDMGMFKQMESVVTNVPRREYTHIDTNLKIYVVEPFGSGGKSATSSTRSATSATPKAAAKTKKEKMVITMGAQFLGTVKMLKLDARHYKTSMQMNMTGDCGTSNISMKTEVWMADVMLPKLMMPRDPVDYSGYSGGNGGSDGCAVTIENKGDLKGFAAAGKGLALKSIVFDDKGNPTMQSEITMLSSAALNDSEFAPPADFKKMKRVDYDIARQSAMSGAFSPDAAKDMLKNMGVSADDSSKSDSAETTEAAPDETPLAEAVAPITSTRIAAVPVAIKNDTKLDNSLIEASKNLKVEEAIAALKNGANPNAVDKSGMTSLMFAAQSGKTELVQTLLDMGANSNATNKKGQTALHFATMIGAPKPKKKGFGGFGKILGGAVLGNAMGGGLGNLGNFGSLLGAGGLDNFLGNNLTGLLGGGAFNLSGKSGWMAIIGTAMQGDIKSNGAFALQRLLVGNSRLDAGGWINLVGAVKGSNLDVLRAMSNIGGDAKWSQFMNVAASGDVKNVTILMSDSKMKPLLNQAMQGFSAASGELPANAAKNIVSELLAKGANANLADSDGKNAAQLFQAREWNDVAALLQK